MTPGTGGVGPLSCLLMNRDRLGLALSSIPFSAWADFEAFASTFLVAEFPELRTTARAAGDRGRDSEIFDIDSRGTNARVKLQYSITRDWPRKIKETVDRLIEVGTKPTTLIYVTNQLIGADADDLKAEIFKDTGVIVDIRDASYFLDRINSTSATAAASEDLARKFVDPLLPVDILSESVAPALTVNEERLAFLHLSLDLNDRDFDKNLTRAAFEALVMATVHGSSAESRVPITDVKQKIMSIVGEGAPGQVDAQIESAISRLEGRRGRIKLRTNDQSIHVAFDEQARIDAATEAFLDQEKSLEHDILSALYLQDDALDTDTDGTTEAIQDVRHCIELMAFEYGEQFSEALRGNTPPNMLFGDEFEHHLAKIGFQSSLSPKQISFVIQMVIEEGSAAGRLFLGRLLESYTVLAMLKSTPDVQRALRKAVAGDEIWVDTSFLLPALAETMGGDERPFESLIRTCAAVDIRLFVTDGVLQEIDTHLRNCLTIVRGNSSVPRYPYLLARFVESGNRIDEFPNWQEEIRGEAQPIQDIADFLDDIYGIVRRPLTSEVDSAPSDLRIATSEYWRQYHQQRRGGTIDAYSVDRLVEHDVENVVGVIQLRQVAGPKSWKL